MIHNNLVKHVLSKNGKIHPLIIDNELTNGTGLMNPSILIDSKDNKIKLILRHVNYTLYHSELKLFHHTYGPLQYIHPENEQYLITKNYYCELDNNYNLISSRLIDTTKFDQPPLWDFIGLEDARLFRWDDKLFTCGVRRDTTTNGQGRMELCEIIEEDNSIKEISRIRIEPPNDSYCEKNWVPILDKPFHFVKWTKPTEIVKVDLNNKTSETVVLKEKANVDIFNDLRGGSQVISYKNYYITITHEVQLFNNILGEKDAIYRHRFIVWDNDWNIVSYSPDFSFMNGDIEFCCGLFYYNNSFLITFGFQDNCAFLLEMPEEIIDDFLINKITNTQVQVQDLEKESIELISTGIMSDAHIYNFIKSIDYPTKELVIFNNNHVDLAAQKIKNNNIEKITICNLPNNIGCVGYWNLTIKSYLNKPYWLIVNDDIEFTPGFLEKMLSISKDPEVGIVHGSKGHYDLGCWSLFLIKDFVIKKYGLFDEIFYPGYCEDMDYHARILADGNTLKRIKSVGLPYKHNGVLISNDDDNKEPSEEHILNFLSKNQKLMDIKWGRGWRWDSVYSAPYNNADLPLSYTSFDLETIRNKTSNSQNNFFEEMYIEACQKKSDICDHLPLLLAKANQCHTVVEFGVRDGQSTRAFLNSKADLISYDIVFNENVNDLFQKAILLGKNCKYIIDDVDQVEMDLIDMLFIDTIHTKAKLQKELEKHASKVRKYIIIHDTYTYGVTGENGEEGMLSAIFDFLIKNSDWKINTMLVNNNGLIILQKVVHV